MQVLKPLIKNFMSFAQERFGFAGPPKLFFKQDIENSKDVLGKTAYYDPQDKSVTVFITNRHPKDILRSLAHELVHHTQNLRGDLTPEKCGEMGPGYAQTNPHLREMERQAFEEGNLCFRDWCDEYKKQLQEVKFLKESKKMTKKLTTESTKKLITKLVKEQQPKYTTEDAYHDKAMRDLIPKILAFAKDRRGDGKGAYISGGTVKRLLANKYQRAVLANPVLQRKFIQMAKPRGGQLPMLIAIMGKALRSPDPRKHFGRTTDVFRSKPAKPGEPKKPTTPRGRTIAAPGAAEGAPLFNDATRYRTPQQKKFNKRLGIDSMNQLRAMVGVPKNQWPKDATQSHDVDIKLLAAIRAFQKDVGVKADGVVGFDTARAARAKKKSGKWMALNVPPKRGRAKRMRARFSPGAGPGGRPLPQRKRTGRKFSESIDPLDEAGGECGAHGPGKADEKDRQGIIADVEEKDMKERQQRKADKNPDSAGNQKLAQQQRDRGMTVKPVNEENETKCEKCENCKDCNGKGCETCAKCKECNPDRSNSDGNKKTPKHDNDPKLKGGQVNLPDALQKGIIQAAESKIYTPEQEQELYESRFNDRNEQIFDKLKKLWTK